MNKKIKNNKNFINKFFSYLPIACRYFLFLIICAGLCLSILQPYCIFFPFTSYYTQNNLIYVIVGLISIIVLSVFLYFLIKNTGLYRLINSNVFFYVVFGITITFILCWQVFLVINVLFIPIGDTMIVSFMQFSNFSAMDLANPDASQLDEYFQYYPNLGFMAAFFLRIFYLSVISGLNEFLTSVLGGVTTVNAVTIEYFILQVFVCILITLAITMITFIVKKLLGKPAALLALFLSCIIIGMSIMCTVVYSDTLGLFCTTTTLWAYICIRRKWLKWPIVLSFTYIGYLIKPTAIAIGIAILFIEICKILANHKISEIKDLCSGKNKFLKNSLICVISTALIFGFVVFGCKSISNYGISENKDLHFGPAHYLMLGLNPSTCGTYSQKDHEFSASFSNQAERTEANLNTAKERLENFGFLGLVRHLSYKTIISFGSGNFIAPNFIELKQKSQDSNPVIESLYSITTDEESNAIDNCSPHNMVAQTLWLIVLFAIAFYLYTMKSNKYVYVIIVSLLAISVFVMISECSQRYFFLYSSYFIVLGTFGIKNFVLSIFNAISKLNNKL